MNIYTLGLMKKIHFFWWRTDLTKLKWSACSSKPEIGEIFPSLAFIIPKSLVLKFIQSLCFFMLGSSKTAARVVDR